MSIPQKTHWLRGDRERHACTHTHNVIPLRHSSGKLGLGSSVITSMPGGQAKGPASSRLANHGMQAQRGRHEEGLAGLGRHQVGALRDSEAPMSPFAMQPAPPHTEYHLPVCARTRSLSLTPRMVGAIHSRAGISGHRGERGSCRVCSVLSGWFIGR